METAKLHIEFLPEMIPGTTQQKMNIKMDGSPVLLAKGIKGAMTAKQDICATFIAGVVSWCHANKVNCGELEKMVVFHK